MEDLARQTLVASGVLAVFFVGPGTAIAFIAWQRRVQRRTRRSPIGIELLRGPGHSLREQIEEAQDDIVWQVMSLSVVPVMMVAFYALQSGVRGAPLKTGLVPFLIFIVAIFIGVFVRKMLKTYERLWRLRSGLDAEVAVGQELDQLMRQGAAVFHDIPADGFNIDHVVIARQGIFAVETKGYTKAADLKGRVAATVVFDGQTLKFPRWMTSDPLQQAERQAQWLSSWISSAVGEEVRALPVLALPGWFIERAGRGPVRVFSGKELRGLLDSRGSAVLTQTMVDRIAHQVEQRCRTVVPSYRRTQGESPK